MEFVLTGPSGVQSEIESKWIRGFVRISFAILAKQGVFRVGIEYVCVGDMGTRGPRVPKPGQQNATWHLPSGTISPRAEKSQF